MTLPGGLEKMGFIERLLLKREKVSFVNSGEMKHSKINILKAHLLSLVYSIIRNRVAV